MRTFTMFMHSKHMCIPNGSDFGLGVVRHGLLYFLLVLLIDYMILSR
jgi:hypothetical protein